MTSEKVLDFLKQKNRPFSINDVCQNVPGVAKTEIQKSLDQLANDSLIFQKTYAKQKIYCVSQNKSNSTEPVLSRINKELTDLTARLEEVESKLQSNGNEIKQWTASGTIEEVTARCQKYTEEIDELNSKVAEYSKITVALTDDEKNNVSKNHENYWKQYKNRKRICTDIIDAIMENYPKPKKHLMDEIEIETDEEVGFTLNK